jgi:Rrf2 family transcriptional regulator, iron-sulfur cluster assembly transcription factor
VMERLAASSIRRPGSVRNFNALAEETGLSHPALEQVIHFLDLAGLLTVPRGPAGGVRLARPPSRISLLEVVKAIDGMGLWRRCILGLQECSDEMPCPAHPVWKQTRALLEEQLDSRSLADLAKAVARRRRARVARGRVVRVDFRPAVPAAGWDSAGDR